MAGPTGYVFAPEAVTFTITLAGGEAGITPLYNWNISAGTIKSGQGTTSIRVDTTDAASYGSVTATALVTGYQAACYVSATGTVEVKTRPVPKKFDEYPDSKPADEEARLDAAAAEFQAEPDSKLYFIVYRSAKTKPGAIEPILQRALTYLTTKQSVSADRIERIYGERRDPPSIEIWFVPPGAGQPKPTVTPPQPKPTPTPKKP
jgi:hypothetical protein